MKRIFAVIYSTMLLLSLAACGSNEQNPPSTEVSPSSSHTETESAEQTNTGRQIQITTEDGNVILFALNDSTAASNLYNQLPLSVAVENYSSNEKILYPPEKLNTHDAPLAEGPAGTLTYYEPWGNVAIYYGDCGGASGLYELGNSISGVEYISAMAGEIQIDAVSASSASSETVDSESRSTTDQQTLSSTQTPSANPQSTSGPTQPPANTLSEDTTVEKIHVQIGGSTFTATLENNSAVDAFVEMMQNAPVVLPMTDYSGFEKVGSLGTSLPTSNSQTTTQAGDIVLYNGNQIVIFYGSHSWSYTRLGRIDDLSAWEEALGSGDVTVTFSVSQ